MIGPVCEREGGNIGAHCDRAVRRRGRGFWKAIWSGGRRAFGTLSGFSVRRRCLGRFAGEGRPLGPAGPLSPPAQALTGRTPALAAARVSSARPLFACPDVPAVRQPFMVSPAGPPKTCWPRCKI